MAEKRTFKFRLSWGRLIGELSDEQSGELLRNLMSYWDNRSTDIKDPMVSLVFTAIQTSMDQDLEKQESLRRQRVEAGKASGAARAKVKPPKIEKEKDHGIDFSMLLGYIIEKTGRKFRSINKSVQAKYRARIKEGYHKKDIMSAIDNAVKTQYHKENGYQYLTPEFFSRASTLDKYGSGTVQLKPEPTTSSNIKIG